jgi:hypothetical protein
MAKRIAKCLSCNKTVRYYDSYMATMEARTVATLTGEIKLQEVQGKICRKCAKSAGYKVKTVDG